MRIVEGTESLISRLLEGSACFCPAQATISRLFPAASCGSDEVLKIHLSILLFQKMDRPVAPSQPSLLTCQHTVGYVQRLHPPYHCKVKTELLNSCLPGAFRKGCLDLAKPHIHSFMTTIKSSFSSFSAQQIEIMTQPFCGTCQRCVPCAVPLILGNMLR